MANVSFAGRMANRWAFRLSMAPMARVDLVDRLAAIEYHLAFGTSERLQLGAVVSAFDETSRAIVTAAS